MRLSVTCVLAFGIVVFGKVSQAGLVCPDGDYVIIGKSCRPCTVCEDFHNRHTVTPCEPHFTDTKCQCDNGYYWHKHYKMCLGHSRCGVGWGVSKKGTPDSNVECHQCPKGTYSSEFSSVSVCKDHTDCNSLGLSLIKLGNKSTDNTCGSYPETSGRHQGNTTPVVHSKVLDGITTKPLKSRPTGTHGFVVTQATTFKAPAGKDGDKQQGMGIGLAIGLSIAVFVLVALGLAFFIRKKRRTASHNRERDRSCYNDHGDLHGFEAGTTYVTANGSLNGSTTSLGAPSSWSRQSGSYEYVAVADMTGP